MRSLINILNPYSVEEFLKNNWTSKAVFISSEGHKKFDPLFSWEKLTYLLNFHEFHYPDLRLVLDGKILDENDNANLIKLCQEGATLIVNKVHKLLPEITNFTIKYPLPDQQSASFPPPEGEPYLSYILNPGDVLYIPRGHWHYAVALDEPSLHLTLGLHCKTGINCLEWLVSELRHKEGWRRSLPLWIETASVKVHVDSLIQDLNEYLAGSNIGQEYISYLDGLDEPMAKYSLPYQAGFNLFLQGTETKFTSQKFQRVRIVELSGDRGYKIIVSGKEVSLKGVDHSLLENLFTGEPFTGSDVINWLPGFDWEIDIVPLLTRLVVEGIIFVDTSIDQK